MTRTVSLPGCAPTPLAAYLKALGILRLVAEQVDAQARGRWVELGFELTSTLDLAGLENFFLEQYRPTPVLAPWNGGSGFYPKDNKSGIEPLASATAVRFSDLRQAIVLSHALLDREGITEKPEAEKKHRLLMLLRNELPDTALVWLDAAVLLADDSPRYPPLLGTGGNDGRLDFTNNFLQRLGELFDPSDGSPRTGTAGLLHEALTGQPSPGRVSAAIGQFAPGASGGPNAGTGFEGGSVVNPWDFILMLEGAVLFAAAATRRLESGDSAALSYPFTLRSTGSGSDATALADEGPARGEIWMPLWSAAATLAELRALFSEGRITLDRRVARDGLDAIRAIARFGADRGIDAFQRFGFLMRSGRAYLATPLARVRVQRNREADLLDELDNRSWLERLRRLARSKDASARLASSVRRLEDVLFDVARGGGTPAVQDTLVALGEVCAFLRTSRAARELCPPPPVLKSDEWVERADDGSPEFRLALALAGLHAVKGVPGDERSPGESRRPLLPMIGHFLPVADTDTERWDDEGSRMVVWGRGDVEANLANILRRRMFEAERLALADKPLSFKSTATFDHISAWLSGSVDTRRVAALLAGLVLVAGGRRRDSASRQLPALPGAYAVLKPLFCTDAQLRRTRLLPPDEHSRLPLSPSLITNLARGRADRALEEAVRRLRVAALPVLPTVSSVTVDSRRLLAALLVPISDHDLRLLL